MGLKVAPDALVVSQDRIRAIDAQGIDMEALSINPYWYKAERDLAQQIIKLQNEKLAEICAEQPERFVAFGTWLGNTPTSLPSSSRQRSKSSVCARR